MSPLFCTEKALQYVGDDAGMELQFLCNNTDLGMTRLDLRVCDMNYLRRE